MRGEAFHPQCELCGKYIFAVDGCKGHRRGDLTPEEKQEEQADG